MGLSRLRLEMLESAIGNFERMIERHHYAQKYSADFLLDDIFAFRESKIKRFEICVDLFWKYLKDVLRNNYAIEVASPKKGVQECYKQNMISVEELEALEVMLDDRNTSVHIYDEEVIASVSDRIDRHCVLIESIVPKIK